MGKLQIFYSPVLGLVRQWLYNNRLEMEQNVKGDFAATKMAIKAALKVSVGPEENTKPIRFHCETKDRTKVIGFVNKLSARRRIPLITSGNTRTIFLILIYPMYCKSQESRDFAFARMRNKNVKLSL